MGSAKTSFHRPSPLKELAACKMAPNCALTDVAPESTLQIFGALTVLLTNIFALYVKTENLLLANERHTFP